MDAGMNADLSKYSIAELCQAKEQLDEALIKTSSAPLDNVLSEISSRGEFTSREFKAIKKGTVFVGMSPEAARCSWGKPSDVNTTVLANYRSEQWVYNGFDGFPSNFIYIENGSVSGIQN